jgi:hypothetical protein
MRTYTDQPGDQPRCGRRGQPIRSCGIGEGFEHLTADPDGGGLVPVEVGHLAWWDSSTGLLHHPQPAEPGAE